MKNEIPEFGYLRLKQIIGDPKAGIPAIVPVSKSTWWSGVKAGIYPQPIKLGPNITAFSAKELRQSIERMNRKQAG